jgi:hypothetical protein
MSYYNYEKAKQAIQDLPQSWIPALLIELIQTAQEKKVFQPGRIHVFVKSVEQPEPVEKPK